MYQVMVILNFDEYHLIVIQLKFILKRKSTKIIETFKRD